MSQSGACSWPELWPRRHVWPKGRPNFIGALSGHLICTWRRPLASRAARRLVAQLASQLASQPACQRASHLECLAECDAAPLGLSAFGYTGAWKHFSSRRSLACGLARPPLERRPIGQLAAASGRPVAVSGEVQSNYWTAKLALCEGPIFASSPSSPSWQKRLLAGPVFVVN